MRVVTDDIADEFAKFSHILTIPTAVRLDIEGIFAEVRHDKVVEQFAAVGVWVGTDAVLADRGEGLEFRTEFSFLIEELFRMIGAKPALQLR